jgi:RES domain
LTPPERHGRKVAPTKIEWPRAWRIIASRFPPINLFERVSKNPAVWGALIELEQLTNPRIRDETGDISLVPAHRRVSGSNASWVMAPFTHVNKRGSRFSNGSYGVYYAAMTLETAIAETIYHFTKFAMDSHDPARREDMRVLLGNINATFDDLPDDLTRASLLHKTSYVHSQAFGLERRSDNSDGIVYPSVRHGGGICAAAFWPDVVGIPIQERHLKYEWDGNRVSRYFDFKLEEWFDAPS